MSPAFLCVWVGWLPETLTATLFGRFHLLRQRLESRDPGPDLARKPLTLSAPMNFLPVHTGPSASRGLLLAVSTQISLLGEAWLSGAGLSVLGKMIDYTQGFMHSLRGVGGRASRSRSPPPHVADREVDESPPQLGRSRWHRESPETSREWKFSFWSSCLHCGLCLGVEHRELGSTGDLKRSSVSSGLR